MDRLGRVGVLWGREAGRMNQRVERCRERRRTGAGNSVARYLFIVWLHVTAVYSGTA
jgi:hypothetical protein